MHLLSAGFSIGGSVVGLVQTTGDTLELPKQCGRQSSRYRRYDFHFSHSRDERRALQRNHVPSTDQPAAEVHSVVLDRHRHRQHIQRHYRLPAQRLDWISWYIPTNTANNYATVTTPLKPLARCSTEHGCTWRARFATTWTDKNAESGSLADSAIPIRLSDDCYTREPPERLVVFDPAALSIWGLGACKPPHVPKYCRRLARGSQAIGSAKTFRAFTAL